MELAKARINTEEGKQLISMAQAYIVIWKISDCCRYREIPIRLEKEAFIAHSDTGK